MEVVPVRDVIEVVLEDLISSMDEIELVGFKEDLRKLKDLIFVAEEQQAGNPVEQQSDSFLIEPNVVGKYQVSKIVEMLISAPPEETHSFFYCFGIIEIFATSLTQYLAKIRWVDDAGYLNEMRVQSIILIDIDSEIADDFVSLLSEWRPSVREKCLVITIRVENISSVEKIRPIHWWLIGLSNDECWSIIKSKVLPRANVQTSLERIGKCIAQRCGGSTLVAEQVGSLIHGKSIDEWPFILQNQLSNFESNHENRIRKTLKLIINHLPSSRKKRFAYCSIFPGKITIKREHLVMLWMAEAYVQAGHGNDIGIVCNRFFNYLLLKFLRNVESGKLPQRMGELSCLSSNNSGADIGATIHVVLQNLLSLSFEEIKDLFGFKKDLTKLKNSLIVIQEVMSDPELRQTNDSAIKSWLERLEVVAFKADAILFEFSYEHLRKIVKNQNRETKKVMSVLTSATTNLLFNREMTRKIKDVIKKLEMLSEQVDSLPLERLLIKKIQPPIWGF